MAGAAGVSCVCPCAWLHCAVTAVLRAWLHSAGYWAKGTPSRGPSAGLRVAASGAVTRTLRGPVPCGGPESRAQDSG